MSSSLHIIVRVASGREVMKDIAPLVATVLVLLVFVCLLAADYNRDTTSWVLADEHDHETISDFGYRFTLKR
jgi:hypothetical protein